MILPPLVFPGLALVAYTAKLSSLKILIKKYKIVTTQVTLTNDADFKQGLMVLADVAVDTPAFDVTGLYLNAARVGSR